MSCIFMSVIFMSCNFMSGIFSQPLPIVSRNHDRLDSWLLPKFFFAGPYPGISDAAFEIARRRNSTLTLINVSSGPTLNIGRTRDQVRQYTPNCFNGFYVDSSRVLKENLIRADFSCLAPLEKINFWSPERRTLFILIRTLYSISMQWISNPLSSIIDNAAHANYRCNLFNLSYTHLSSKNAKVNTSSINKCCRI